MVPSIPFFDSLVPWFGALLAAGIAVSVPTPDEGKIAADTSAWSHRSFKAIRKIGGTGSAGCSLNAG
jgi:hypothetical protein